MTTSSVVVARLPRCLDDRAHQAALWIARGRGCGCAADEHAARQSTETALNLASALVKIAKMVPVRRAGAVPMAVFLVGVEETRGVKARVRRLLDMASMVIRRRVPAPAIARFLPVASLFGLLLVAFVVASNPIVLVNVHNVIERAVAFLS